MDQVSVTPRLLYLSKSDIAGLDGGRSDLYVDAVHDALVLHAQGQIVQPLKPYLRWGADGHIADRIIAMPAYLGGESPAAGLKWVGSRHDNPVQRGLERASALVVLNDTASNYPIAVMEGSRISGMRTAAVTTVAARHLARPGFSRVACIGCGPIARMQLETLLEHFPAVTDLFLYDLNPEAAVQLTLALGERFGSVEFHIATAEPYIPFEWLRPGVFVSNVSIMDLHKEVFLQVDKVVVDDWDQSNREKKIINQLVLEGRFSREQLHAELGEILVGRRPGRETEHERILLNPMGMAIEDVACAKAIYDRAAKAQVGTWLNLY